MSVCAWVCACGDCPQNSFHLLDWLVALKGLGTTGPVHCRTRQQRNTENVNSYFYIVLETYICTRKQHSK